MKKKKLVIVGIVLSVIAVVTAVIILSPSWSKKTFEGVVKELVTKPNGEIRLIVQRTTEIYADPMNSLHISDDTVLIDSNGETISVDDLQQGYTVEVTLKDSFVEETPFYYPTVYQIEVIDTNK